MDNRSKLPIISETINQINDAVKKMNSNIVFFSATHQELRVDIENEAAYYVNTSLQLFKIKNNVQTTLLYNKFATKYTRKRCSVRQTYYTTKKI